MTSGNPAVSATGCMVKRASRYGGNPILQLPIAAFMVALLSGCGNPGSSGDPISEFEGGAGEPFLQPTLPEDPELGAASAAAVFADAGNNADSIIVSASRPTDLPFEDPTNFDNISSLTTLADTGIQVGFRTGLSSESVDLSLIEDSWTRMQSCLSVVAVSPMVIVSDELILPLSGGDDILYHLDGSITATSSRFAAGATIQITLDDLDGSLNRVGFNLRSIMGRYLWTDAGLPERDYPHSCASS